jgi:hypothetical protein
MRPALAAAVALALAVAGIAVADTQTVNDPKDASPSRIDIKTAVAAHSGSKLVHTINTFGKFESKLLKNTGPAKYMCLYLWRSGTTPLPGAQDFQVCASFQGNKLKGSIYSIDDRKLVGSVRVSRPNKRALRFAFAGSIIGADEYYWLATAKDKNKFDAAPGTPMLHKVAP